MEFTCTCTTIVILTESFWHMLQLWATQRIAFEGSFFHSFLTTIHTSSLKVQYYAISKAPFSFITTQCFISKWVWAEWKWFADETHFYLKDFSERLISVVSLCKVMQLFTESALPGKLILCFRRRWKQRFWLFFFENFLGGTCPITP